MWLQASKAAVISFYESVRAEFGKDIKVTVLTPGYVESELTKGKALQKGGDICVNEEARDVCFQISIKCAANFGFS